METQIADIHVLEVETIIYEDSRTRLKNLEQSKRTLLAETNQYDLGDAERVWQ